MSKGISAIRNIVIPFISGCDNQNILRTASYMHGNIVLIGVISVSPECNLSASTQLAHQLREDLQKLKYKGFSNVEPEIVIASNVCEDINNSIQKIPNPLIIFDYDNHIKALNSSLQDILDGINSHIAILHGQLQERPNKVLVPVRGGPHAELALRVGLRTLPNEIEALHLYLENTSQTETKVYKALEKVITQLSHVNLISKNVTEPVNTILEHADNCDLVVMGSTARDSDGGNSLGNVVTKIISNHSGPVIIVRTKKNASDFNFKDESVASNAISVLVDRWFATRTYSSREFSEIDKLIKLKEQQNISISLALPALNEEKTVGKVISVIQNSLVNEYPLIDEIVLIDSNSSDNTRNIAKHLGIPVYIHQQILPEYGSRRGKGEALWKSLYVTKGDIIAWIDTDIDNIDPRFVYGIIGPLLTDSKIQIVKAFYRRPIKTDHGIYSSGGGRVTELTARPLLNLFYPELSGVIQPLSGEYAGRRSALENFAFTSGYGVESSLLIEAFEKFGLNAIAQVDVHERIHHNQPLQSLSKMSFVIMQTILQKAAERIKSDLMQNISQSMKLIRAEEDGYFLEVEELTEHIRPAMKLIKEYNHKFSN